MLSNNWLRSNINYPTHNHPAQHLPHTSITPHRPKRSPPQRMPEMSPPPPFGTGKKCLALDLDETLVHSSFQVPSIALSEALNLLLHDLCNIHLIYLRSTNYLSTLSLSLSPPVSVPLILSFRLKLSHTIMLPLIIYPTHFLSVISLWTVRTM